jgi:hypothetical protein
MQEKAVLGTTVIIRAAETLDGDFRSYRWGKNQLFDLLIDL